ncbi:TAT-variant-translocated molybdopterin oxidoreductase [Candidatus Arcticimaribacter forsetii]|uniref:TAT-variant-translocated molybdopterin oxidoreductase n=1 Tax=Candidatus Arcticimaribacter forsetii TaxID=2820661 RepID=UPI0020776A1E|nr:TAT-variant-translocated molybdopterin oxidoreductase [Candidatus Arcticimaribacter forsetii]MDB4674318.1 TAT-variant-translocated molybdopterin oxidoreductase [Flavobacteriaceae bacterium]
MAENKTYWKSADQLKGDNPIIEQLEQKEFAEHIPVNEFLGDSETLEDTSTSRRDFLKYVGFSTAAATLAACEGPVIKSVPYVVQPEQIRPGVANYYATAIADGFDFGSVLIKTREGRPIKVENNNDAPVLGGANARVHASVLSLYDVKRLQGPKANGSNITWEDLNLQVGAKLKALAATGKEVVLLTQTFASPTTSKIVSDFVAVFPNVKHVTYDSVSDSAALDAFEDSFGVRGLADYDFSKADTIVSIGADFLGDWQGGGYDSGYSKNRIPTNGRMSQHFQFEANMSLSGASADFRIPATPAQQKNILAHLYAAITGITISGSLEAGLKSKLDKAVKALKAAGSKAVVVSGIQEVGAQKIVLAINHYLQSEVMNADTPRLIRQGNDAEVSAVITAVKNGTLGGLITAGVNPALTLADGKAFAEGVKKLDLSVAFSLKEDETALASQYVAAVPHYLEAWGDYEFKAGSFALAQPTIRPLFDTKQFQDVLLAWSGSTNSYYEAIKSNWNSTLEGLSSWNTVLHDGFYQSGITSSNYFQGKALPSEANALAAASSSGLELVLYTKTGMGDGQQSNNPWLQEFPDPITRVSWDNYITVSASDAAEAGLKNVNVANGALNGSYAKVTVGGTTLTVPVIIQPGQAKGSIGLALGYGEKAGLQEEMQVGVNAFEFYNDFKPVQNASIALAEGFHEFACVQLHNTLMGRGDIIKETTLEVFNTKDKAYWNAIPVVSKNHMEEEVTSEGVDMWQNFDRSIGHHFNLSIDLNACTGCGACVIACHSENNVPVVGKTEVRRSRDMHWLRIDRYYSSETTFEGDNQTKENIDGLGDSLTTFGEMENPSENPQVTFQPVMCQHCNHAPCETVCPVAATSHGRQGQNHMAYNRCVGTRYCANNCPYKVRRFNWFLYNQNDEFDYHMNNDLGRMVLNPDVVVRSRGVMEKCSMCIQKTQKTILDAKLDGREIKDGEFQTACSSACSNGAMTFGDINDKESEIAHLKENDRMYHLLESVGTKPNVMYQAKVRNT